MALNFCLVRLEAGRVLLFEGGENCDDAVDETAEVRSIGHLNISRLEMSFSLG